MHQGLVAGQAAPPEPRNGLAMLNRWIGIISLFVMLGVNAMLWLHDVAPGWLTGDPPVNDALNLRSGEERRSQAGIYDASGRAIGHSWTIAKVNGALLNIHTWTMLRSLELPGDLRVPAIRIESEFIYRQDGHYQNEQVDIINIQVQVEGLERVPLSLNGQYYSPNEFGFEWKVADRSGMFILEPAATRALGDMIRPFDRLPGLFVGRTWRIKLFNPLATVLPGRQAEDMQFDAVTARVTTLEPIEHNGRKVEAFCVETSPVKMRAWVANDGRVLRQEMDLPLLGRIMVVDEPVDETLRKKSLRMEMRP